MADQANERLRALKASVKEALGKLTGSDELEAQGALERSGGGSERDAEADAAPRAKAAPQAKDARPARAAKARTPRRRS